MKNKKKHYNEEFKEYAVNYYNSSGESLKLASEELKISESNLNNWVQSSLKDNGLGKYSSHAEKEIIRLKKELHDKENALEILKKALDELSKKQFNN